MNKWFRILVAEDDPNDLLLLKIAVRKVNPHTPVFVVRDGQETMDYLQGNPPYHDRSAHPTPDLLLLDLKMPRLDGFAVLEWMLWRPELRPRFVVVLTSSEYPEDMRRVKVLGADSYLVKPQEPGELVCLVQGLGAYWLDAVREPECAMQ